jgi:hypothetical protein
MWRFKLTNLVRSDYSIAVDQIIRYPVPSNNSRYTFSFCAFPRRVLLRSWPVISTFLALLPTERISHEHAERRIWRGRKNELSFWTADRRGLLRIKPNETSLS